jgi:DNA-directed RNA polymerase specialized sigma24 family protein
LAPPATGSVARQIESLFDGGSVAGLSDRQLLERFTTQRDAGAEVAFAALVARHAPMVLGICRQILGNRHDAEDAFQAVVIVLACKARSIRNPDLVGSWLFGVALRTAHKANTRLGRQRKNEEGDVMSGLAPVSMVEPMVPPAEVSAMTRE